MKNLTTKAALLALLLASSAAAYADFGVGLKAGTLGLGVEGRWSPLPWLDLRLGANQYDLDTTGTQASVDYDATFAMENYFLTGNIRFPLSPFRVTLGAYSNGNEIQMTSQDTVSGILDFGGDSFNTSAIGSLQSVTTFDSTSPYFGVGYDFEVFGKVGLNLDFGVLWQGEPSVSLFATDTANASVAELLRLNDALAIESSALEDEISDYKAWPVLSLSFVYNF